MLVTHGVPPLEGVKQKGGG